VHRSTSSTYSVGGKPVYLIRWAQSVPDIVVDEVAPKRLELALGMQPWRNDRGEMVKSHDLKLMSVEELWSLHELVAAALARKMQAETAKLDQRLRQLSLAAASHNGKKRGRARRPYPPVYAKYRNPAEPSETWAGRGKRPRWLSAQLKSGKKIDDFRIDLATAQAAQ
jgi:DNA-binding protein H-NS